MSVISIKPSTDPIVTKIRGEEYDEGTTLDFNQESLENILKVYEAMAEKAAKWAQYAVKNPESKSRALFYDGACYALEALIGTSNHSIDGSNYRRDFKDSCEYITDNAPKD